MPVSLTAESQRAVEDFLYQLTEKDHLRAIQDLLNLPDKEAVALHICDNIRLDEDDWRRTWCITALGWLGQPETIPAIVERLDPQKESYEWARYWAAVALARIVPAPDSEQILKQHLSCCFQKDQSYSVRAIALRLLVEKGYDDEFLKPLLSMINNPNWECRRATCKVLRPERAATTTLPAFKERVEVLLIPALGERAINRWELNEVRYQAIQALKSMRHRTKDVIQILSDALRRDLKSPARRACVEALAGLEHPDTKEALLFALEDNDAEVRLRAAMALKKALPGLNNGSNPQAGEGLGAIQYVVEHLLREDLVAQDPASQRRYANYIEALRKIDDKEAARVLSGYLFDPSPVMIDRASQALTELGGEAALRTLQAQRTQAVEKYTELLGKADDKIMEQFDNLMQHARFAYRMSMIMHATTFVMGILLLLASLNLALTRPQQDYWTAIGLGVSGSLITLLTLFYRDPLRNIGHSVNRLVKVNVVFLGYVRQINQIDATFKQLFLDSTVFSIDQMKDTVKQIQNSVGQTLEEIQLYLIEEEGESKSSKKEAKAKE